ncbi:hypothetical protein L6452_15345 [Arctium lappa]|uniref:Uncharacterized protein n=1 Tax=Arctium lappa TaxID=4217 RepID=A0ACB9CNI9_ARCLA|nr:hypothetical protein L6452_15345 [Arctium lappa]
MDAMSKTLASLGLILLLLICVLASDDGFTLKFYYKLDALEADMGMETKGEGLPSYLQHDNEPEEINFPSAPSGHASRVNNQVLDRELQEYGVSLEFNSIYSSGASSFCRDQVLQPDRSRQWLRAFDGFDYRHGIDVFNRVLDVYQCPYFTSHVCSLLDLSMVVRVLNYILLIGFFWFVNGVTYNMGLAFSRLRACLRCGGPTSAAGEVDDADDDRHNSSDLFLDLPTLQAATNFFSESNQLGHGGFGPVYKGLLPNGQEVAIKKLSLSSRQGVREFTNEVKLLLKIQHRNLVMLLGCCVDGPEKMLVYEYLPNKSLDYILFDKEKSRSLHWTQRFQIIIGVLRGLLYLHEEAPIRIIHRDIKASNILLDEKLNPKISDFGLARLFPGDDTHVNTFRISGTHGYMAPEYAIHGYLSVKADVFSFGILVLEIVSGRKVTERQLDSQKSDLLTYTWSLFQTGKQLELVDESLDTCNPSEAAMCIQLGLLCCQAIVSDRPDVNALHLMLSNDSFTLPRPGRPGLQGRGGRWTTTTSSALTTTNASTTLTNHTKQSISSSVDYSRNSMSVSSMNEGR